MILQSRLEAAVSRLPLSAGGVADFLVDRGITGVKDACKACPMARWLRKELQVPLADVDDGRMRVVDDQSNSAYVDTPRGVFLFITAFDRGEFSDLIDHEGLTAEEVWTNDHDV